MIVGNFLQKLFIFRINVENLYSCFPSPGGKHWLYSTEPLLHTSPAEQFMSSSINQGKTFFLWIFVAASAQTGKRWVSVGWL